MAKQTAYHYSIDADDRIRSVSNLWLAFARENGAPGLTRESLLGRSLWHSVRGRSTRDAYQLLFDWVRERGAQVSVPFRCDSPGRLRFMHMYIAPADDRGIDLQSVLLREVPREPPARWLEPDVLRMRLALPCCSFCRQVRIGGEWLEWERASARLGLTASSPVPLIEYEVCAACDRLCRARIEDMPQA